MKIIKGLCLATLFAISAATAQEPTPAAQQHEELRKLQAAMEAALNARDLDALIANLDENVVFTTMNGDVATGREGIREYFKIMMEGPGKRVESVTTDFIPDALSVFYGDDVAVAFGSSNDDYVLTSGSKFTIKGRWTATLVHKDGRWLVGAFHYSANVFDNPILKMQRKFLTWGGFAIALLFAAIGFFVGRRRRVQPAA
jgi:uncharacterized protein (TIGR02246 family)